MREGLFIVAIEGADKVGKHTQCLMLFKRLVEDFQHVRIYELPSKNHKAYGRIQCMLKNLASEEEDISVAEKYPMLFQEYQTKNRLEVQEEFLKGHNEIIVLDRWDASGHVYGEAMGLSRDQIDETQKDLIKPDIVIVIHGIMHLKNTRDLLEDSEDLQKQVRLNYKTWVDEFSKKSNYGKVFSIDGDRAREEVHHEIINIVLPQCEKWMKSNE